MTKIGYAAMLEQFHPTELLDYCAAAEEAGFEPGSWSASTSSHGRRSRARAPSPGRSWARSAQRTALPFGTAVTCPGFRYHPVVIAHAAATLAPCTRAASGWAWRRRGAQRARHRRRLAGGRAIRIGDDVRGDRDHQQALHRQGRPARRARLHARERRSSTRARSRRCRSTSPRRARSTPRGPGKLADGMITVGAADEKIGMIWDKLRGGRPRGRQGPDGDAEAAPDPRLVGAHGRGGRRRTRSSSGPTAAWPSPSRTSRTPRTSRGWPSSCAPRTSRTGCSSAPTSRRTRAHIQHYVDMGFDEIHLHNVGRNQTEFIEVFGREVMPNAEAGRWDGAAATTTRSRPRSPTTEAGRPGPRGGDVRSATLRGRCCRAARERNGSRPARGSR